MSITEADHPYRLPRHVVPSRYQIRLEPDLAAATFAGSQIVDVQVTEATDTIVLNAIELDIYEAHLRNADEHHVEAVVAYDEDLQRATLTLDEAIQPGLWQLYCGFTGILNDQLHGFYRSTYTDVDGNEQVIATTQFEATDARRAFPCWDEPEFKATFGVTLVVPDDLLAVSNGAEIRREPVGGGKVAITYADTVKMSTYLVAFVVGPFEATDPVDVNGVPLRIIAPKGKLHLTDFALESGEFCLDYLADYYDIPYPGDKVDMVAIPDFAFGAMENLGCITYRETALLVDTATATQQERLRVLDVIAHELAHMWFGDLVTMKWWNGIWLNEAFATFMETKATDARRPDWKRWVAFGAVERPWAFSVDALSNTRPVEFEVNSPDEANEMFDALTYGKGSSVLRMMEQYLGEEVFRSGVGAYLRRHSYANTETEDLWAALNEASGEPVGEIMDTWILQGGYPVVDAAKVAGGIELSQRRFLVIPDETDQTEWKVPIGIRGVADGQPFSKRVLLDGPSTVVPVDGDIDWFIANAGGHGFFRVWYTRQADFHALLDRLSELDDLERYTVADDAVAFVQAGQATAASFLEVAEIYKHEPDQAIWQTIIGGLSGLNHHVVTDDERPAFQDMVADILGPVSDRLGWDVGPDDDDLTRRLRGQVIGALGQLVEDPAVLDRAYDVALAWLDDPSSVDADVGQACLFTAAAHADEAFYDKLMAGHHAAVSPQVGLKLLQAAASADDTSLTDKTLEAAKSGSIRSQDVSWVVARLFGNRVSGPHAWRAVRSDWSAFVERIPPMTLRRLAEGLPSLSQPHVAADVQSFFAETPIPAIAKAVAQNLEKLEARVAMRARESGKLPL